MQSISFIQASMTSVRSRATMGSDACLDYMAPVGSQKFMRQFIQVYKANPILWDPSHVEYTNKYHRIQAQDKLLEVLKRAQPEATRGDVIRKINTIRTNYNRCVRAVKMAEAEGREYTPTNWQYSELRFLDTIKRQDEQNGSGEEQTYETNNDYDGSYDAGIENIKIETAYSSPTEFVEVETKPHETDETPPHLIKKRKLMKKRIPAPRQERQTGQPSSSIPSGIEPIALVWSSKLQSLQPTQRLLAEKAINDVLFEASLNTLTRTSVVINAAEPESVSVEVPEEYIEYTYTDQDE